jgi:DNA mismatch repair protein MutL
MGIKVLASEVISRIAAGEVVERPASVVKELIENSLDAAATQIAAEARNGGVELIQVSDDGAGIASPELELAFHRYATSKISDLDDLGRLLSLGFRGEALASIAAVADVEIMTQTSSGPVGDYMCLRHGEVVRRESRARPRGTTVTVTRLFRYLPARLKFLRSTSTENGHIAHLLTQYALAFPEVRFGLVLDGRQGLRTDGNGNLQEVVSCVYGPDIAERMLRIDRTDGPVRVSGLVSPPAVVRSTRNYLSFFVNRRWVRSPLLARAMEEAYRGLLMDGRHPIAVIDVSLPAQELDVNIHPAKAQVRFCQEQIVFAAVRKAIAEALARTPLAATPRSAPFSPGPQGWQGPQMVMEDDPVFAITQPPAPQLPVLRILGQLASTYVIAEGPDGLYLIDQHAAHERILYERLLEQRSRREVEAQGLLQPIALELSPREEESMRLNRELLEGFGFSIDPFGGRSYLIRAIPAMMAEADIASAVGTLLDNLTGTANPDGWDDKIAQSLACHGSIRAGQQLSNEEMRELIKQLEQTRQPRTCPHGRSTMIHLSSHRLEKEFGRIT